MIEGGRGKRERRYERGVIYKREEGDVRCERGEAERVDREGREVLGREREWGERGKRGVR